MWPLSHHNSVKYKTLSYIGSGKRRRQDSRHLQIVVIQGWGWGKLRSSLFSQCTKKELLWLVSNCTENKRDWKANTALCWGGRGERMSPWSRTEAAGEGSAVVLLVTVTAPSLGCRRRSASSSFSVFAWKFHQLSTQPSRVSSKFSCHSLSPLAFSWASFSSPPCQFPFVHFFSLSLFPFHF